MAASRYEYDRERRRFRDRETGEILTAAALAALKEQFIASQQEKARAISARLSAGDISSRTWAEAMQAEIKASFLALAALGGGGVNTFSLADVQAISSEIGGQLPYLTRLQAVAETLSPAKLAQRAQMYIAAAAQAYERGKARAYDGLVLPDYPASGTTSCLSSCRCEWSVEETDEEWLATWVVDAGAESCPECLQRGEEWAPLIVPK